MVFIVVPENDKTSNLIYFIKLEVYLHDGVCSITYIKAENMIELNQLICGKMLGDGSLNPSNNGKTARFIIKHKQSDKDYVLDQYNLFTKLGLEFQSNCPKNGFSYDNRTKETYYYTACASRFYDFLAGLYKIWYDSSDPKHPI